MFGNDIRIQKTGAPDILRTSDGRLTLSVPIPIKRRSGESRGWGEQSGEAKSLKEIATREGIDNSYDNSYVSRMVNLTTLAPDIVAAILDDVLPNHVTLFDLAIDPSALWDEQRERLGGSANFGDRTYSALGRCAACACSIG